MDPMTPLARSWLFVPADRPDRFAKAAASGADRVVIDLEDAVAPEAKRAACRRLVGLTLPDAEGAADVARAAAALPATLGIVPIVETARGAWDALDVARAPRVERLAF